MYEGFEITLVTITERDLKERGILEDYQRIVSLYPKMKASSIALALASLYDLGLLSESRKSENLTLLIKKLSNDSEILLAIKKFKERIFNNLSSISALCGEYSALPILQFRFFFEKPLIERLLDLSQSCYEYLCVSDEPHQLALGMVQLHRAELLEPNNLKLLIENTPHINQINQGLNRLLEIDPNPKKIPLQTYYELLLIHAERADLTAQDIVSWHKSAPPLKPEVIKSFIFLKKCDLLREEYKALLILQAENAFNVALVIGLLHRVNLLPNAKNLALLNDNAPYAKRIAVGLSQSQKLNIATQEHYELICMTARFLALWKNVTPLPSLKNQEELERFMSHMQTMNQIADGWEKWAGPASTSNQRPSVVAEPRLSGMHTVDLLLSRRDTDKKKDGVRSSTSSGLSL